MAHFVLIYELAPDYLDRRPEFRGAHLALAQAAVARDELILGGALADPVDRAMLLFSGIARRLPRILRVPIPMWPMGW